MQEGCQNREKGIRRGRERESVKRETKIETWGEVIEMEGDTVREKHGNQGRVLKHRVRNRAQKEECLRS